MKYSHGMQNNHLVNLEKNIRQTKGDILLGTLPVLVKTIKVMKKKNKQKMKNSQGSEEIEETWWLNVMWCLGQNPGTKEDISAKTSEIHMKSGVCC